VSIAPAMLAMVAAVIAVPLASLTAVPAPAVDAARGSCTHWRSTTVPPPVIRVYRVSEGFVETVDFKDYVKRVVSREWNVKQKALRLAGAHAVKQYAWYHVLHWRGGKFEGQCFDVRDTTADQLYANKPLHQIPRRVKRAVNKTWTWTLMRGDKFPATGYRRGKRVACAADAGYRLHIRSARKCANKGWSARHILEVYYSAVLVKNGSTG
jgi:peptidoglycan hydrolase-like amidase